MGLSDFFKKGVEKPAPEIKKADVKPVAPAVTPPVTSTAAPLDEKYTIKKGDSLSLIAKHYYGDAKKWTLLYEANKSQIKDPDKIFPGMEIIIPKN